MTDNTEAPFDAPGAPPSASIAMATYNGERYLSRQLETIAAQTVQPSELVVTDDGSSDGTMALLEQFARAAPFSVRLYSNERTLGFQRNFRRAIQLCTSELIFFCDQDDVWRPDKIEKMREVFSDPEVLLAYHGACIVDADERRLAPMYHAGEQAAFLAHTPMHPWFPVFGLVQVFRSRLRAYDDLWDRSLNHTWHDILAHDQWYIFLALVLGKVRFVDEELVLYRQHGNNTVGADRQRTSWQRVLARFEHDPAADARGWRAAVRRAEILRTISERTTDESQRDRVMEVAAAYDLLSGRLARRETTYTASTSLQRLAGLGVSTMKGDYSGNPWGFDWRSIPRDLVAGVVRGGPARGNP